MASLPNECMPRVICRLHELSSDGSGGESSAAIRTRVAAAREIQTDRFRKSANDTSDADGWINGGAEDGICRNWAIGFWHGIDGVGGMRLLAASATKV